MLVINIVITEKFVKFKIFHWLKYEGPYTYVREADCDQLTKLTGIVIDWFNKKAYFLKVIPETFKTIKIIKKVTNLPKSVIIFAAVKGFGCFSSSYTGITLIKDSLPFPDLEGLSDYEGIPWEEENKDLIKHNWFGQPHILL